MDQMYFGPGQIDVDLYHMALATTVFAKGNGSRITFSGDPEDYTDVEESPETVISLVVDEKNADRT